MAKVILGKRPESFKKTVEFPVIDGETGKVATGKIEFDYKYRTRKEFGSLIDSEFGAKAPAEQGGPDFGTEAGSVTIESVMERSCEANADYMLKIAKGWSLDVPWSREALIQLADEMPGSIVAGMNGYREAVVEGRLGN